MSKLLTTLILTTAALASGAAYASNSPQITFGIDCMIHDDQGKMVSDLGMVGAMMGGYVDIGNFQYGDLKIEANLNGPFSETPEVKSPRIKLTVFDSKGGLLASEVTSANQDINTALFVPSEKVYLHCEKMDM